MKTALKTTLFCVSALIGLCGNVFSDPSACDVLSKSMLATYGTETPIIGNSYTRGKITIELDEVHTGTFVGWRAPGGRFGFETVIEMASAVYGDNGEFHWSVSPDGTVEVFKSDSALLERRLETLESEYEHMNCRSEVFKIEVRGTAEVGDACCYVVSRSNNINQTVMVQYIDTLTYYVMKEVEENSDDPYEIGFSDFRKLDGIVIPFRCDSYLSGVRMTLITDSISIGVDINQSIFEPPATTKPTEPAGQVSTESSSDSEQ